MNRQRIRELLARYEAAETSVAEERELKRLLRAPNLPEEFSADAAYFGVVQVLAKAQPTAAAQNQPWLTDETQAVRTLRNSARRTNAPALSSSTRNYRTRNYRTLAYAAAAVLAISVAILVGLRFQGSSLAGTDAVVDATIEQPAAPVAIDWSKFEVTDPNEASRITRAALVGASKRLNRGSKLASREVRRIDPIHHAFPTDES